MVAPSVRVAMRRQGSQFTSTDFIKVLASPEIKISMPLRACAQTVGLTVSSCIHRKAPAGNRRQGSLPRQRLYRAAIETIKYEEVYLHADANVPKVRASIGRSIGFYNGRRPHSSRDGKTPDQAYLSPQTPV